MFKTIIDFWSDDTGIDKNVTLLIHCALGVAITAVVFTTVFVGLKNLSVKTKGDIENASP